MTIAEDHAEAVSVGRLLERVEHATAVAEQMQVRAVEDSGRLARIESGQEHLASAVREHANATREQTAVLRGGIDRAIATARAAGRRAVANAERIDKQALRIDSISQRVAAIEGEQRDAKTSRKTLLAVGSSILLLASVLNATGALVWVRDRIRAVLPHYDASVDEDGVGENDDDRPSVAGW